MSLNLYNFFFLSGNYCSYAYQEKLKEYGYTCSMSQKGNCWDNAPMESFWGKMKQEWLNGQKSKTRAEAKAKVFEYIMIFYNRKRLHASLTEPSSLRKNPITSMSIVKWLKAVLLTRKMLVNSHVCNNFLCSTFACFFSL